jgi:hypothetical protein
VKLCADTERLLNEAYLPNHIALCQPPYLSLADHVNPLPNRMALAVLKAPFTCT